MYISYKIANIIGFILLVIGIFAATYYLTVDDVGKWEIKYWTPDGPIYERVK